MAWKGWSRAASVVTLAGLLACGKSGGDMTSPSSEALQGHWTLVSLQQAGGSVEVAPSGYIAEFQADGTLAARADCNSCHTTYVVEGASLKVGQAMACTRAYCLSAPFDTRYTTLLGAATSWQTNGGMLELRSGAGALTFRR
jgi:heat shock protein HslJ